MVAANVNDLTIRVDMEFVLLVFEYLGEFLESLNRVSSSDGDPPEIKHLIELLNSPIENAIFGILEHKLSKPLFVEQLYIHPVNVSTEVSSSPYCSRKSDVSKNHRPALILRTCFKSYAFFLIAKM